MSLPRHDDLFALSLLRPETLTVDGKAVADRIVIMMDDIHMLTSAQRSFLVARAIEDAEFGGYMDRGTVRGARCPRAAGGGVPKRAGTTSNQLRSNGTGAGDTSVSRSTLCASRTGAFAHRSRQSWICFDRVWRDDLGGAVIRIGIRGRRRVRCRLEYGRGSARNSQFEGWYQSRVTFDGSSRDRALRWRALEIVIERVLRRPAKGDCSRTRRAVRRNCANTRTHRSATRRSYFSRRNLICRTIMERTGLHA